MMEHDTSYSALVRRGAIGTLVRTHDLALTGIPETMDGVAQNCHFADGIEDGNLKFGLPAAAGSGTHQQCAKTDAGCRPGNGGTGSLHFRPTPGRGLWVHKAKHPEHSATCNLAYGT